MSVLETIVSKCIEVRQALSLLISDCAEGLPDGYLRRKELQQLRKNHPEIDHVEFLSNTAGMVLMDMQRSDRQNCPGLLFDKNVVYLSDRLGYVLIHYKSSQVSRTPIGLL